MLDRFLCFGRPEEAHGAESAATLRPALTRSFRGFGERHSCRQRYGSSTVAAHRRLVPGITIASIQRKARTGARKVVQLVGYVCNERLALVAINRVGQCSYGPDPPDKVVDYELCRRGGRGRREEITGKGNET